REIADDRALVLQVVVEAQSLVGEVLADDRHGEVRPILAAERLRQGKAQMPGAIRAAPHLRQELLPFTPRPTVLLPVGPGMLTAVVEELQVLALERLDLAFDEVVERGELPRDRVGNGKIHGGRHVPGGWWRAVDHGEGKGAN